MMGGMRERDAQRRGRAGSTALRGLLHLAACAALAPVLPGAPSGAGVEAALARIDTTDLERDVRALAAPELEGRDSPSPGLAASAALIEARLRGAGVAPVDGATYRLPFVRSLSVPDPFGCTVVFDDVPGGVFALGEDFSPLVGSSGKARGEAVFVGYGIRAPKEDHDDLRGVELDGRIAVLLAGEPEDDERFDGGELSRHANVRGKVETLLARGVSGVVVLRDGAAPFGHRHGFAEWNTRTGPGPDRAPSTFEIPVVELSASAGAVLLGVEVLDPVQLASIAPRSLGAARLSARFRQEAVSMDNVAGVVRGTDEALGDEYVVVGAHYDHLGLDARGRIAYGADDNASGTAALLEIAEALALSPARRSVLFVAFAAEEDGLVGSQAFCLQPPDPREAIVAMLNLDMVGRGPRELVVVLGTRQNRGLRRVLERAQELAPTGIEEVVTNAALELWTRSDHYSFHRFGIPTLFFFESRSESENADYHTFRDTPDLVDYAKVANVARLVFNTTWIIANDDEAPPPPRG